MSDKLAGEFLNEYITWRNEKISIHFPFAKSDELNVDTYLKNDKYSTVKTGSDDLLNNVLNYYQTDLGLQALQITRPLLNLELAEFVQDDKSKDLYPKYAKLVLLKFIHEKQTLKIIKTCVPSIVKKEVVEKDLKKVTSNTHITKHSMMMTFISIMRKSPELIPYLAQSDKFIEQLKSKLITPAYRDQWIQDTIKIQKEKINEDNYDNLRFNDLKFKLDLLDPTFALSNEILSKYYSAMLVYYSLSKMKNTPLVKSIYQASMQQSIKEILETGGEWVTYIEQLKAIYGPSLLAFYSKMTQAIVHLAMSGGGHDYNAKHVFSFDSAKLYKFLLKGIPEADGNKQLEASKKAFSKLMGDKNFYRFANGLLICAQAAAIYYGIKNWNNLTTFQKVLFVGTSALSVVDVLSAVTDNSLFFKIGKKIVDWVSTTNYKIVEKVLTKFCYCFVKTAVFISKYVTPILIFISICFTAYELFMSVKAKNWGLVAIDVVELGVSLGLLGIAIFSIFVATAWAGPVCMILTGVLMIVAIIKVLYILFEPDPDSKFVISCETKYRYTDGNDFAIQFYKNALYYNNEVALLVAKLALQALFPNSYLKIISDIEKNKSSIVVR